MNYATWGSGYSSTFRELADAAAARAVADLDNPSFGKHRGQDGLPLTHTPHAAEAVVLSVIALEAGINEMATWLRHNFVVSIQPLCANFERASLRNKWALFPHAMVGSELTRGQRPWQDFEALVKLRNGLAHFKWEEPKVPGFIRDLQTQDLTIPELPGIYWVDAALTDRVAIWATSTSTRMFAALAALLGRDNDGAWPWQ